MSGTEFRSRTAKKAVSDISAWWQSWVAVNGACTCKYHPHAVVLVHGKLWTCKCTYCCVYNALHAIVQCVVHSNIHSNYNIQCKIVSLVLLRVLGKYSRTL